MGLLFFSFYYIRKKMTVITNKHCLQKLLIAPLWDDVNPVFDHRPRAIFQIFLHYKKKQKKNTLMWGKKAFAVLWLQIITTQWTNICLVNSSIMNPRPRDCGAIWNLPVCYFLCHMVTCACDTHQTWVELLRGHPASLPVWGAHNFLMHHLGFIKAAEKHLCVSSSACHKMPRDWFKEGKRRADAAISETLVERKATLTRKGPLKIGDAFFFNKILWKGLQGLDAYDFVFSEKSTRLVFLTYMKIRDPYKGTICNKKVFSWQVSQLKEELDTYSRLHILLRNTTQSCTTASHAGFGLKADLDEQKNPCIDFGAQLAHLASTSITSSELWLNFQ